MNCPSCRAENEASASACAACGATLMAPTQVVVAVDLKPGTLFHSRYEILAPLGQGGMGMVYKARDRTLDEVVAIKVLRPDFAQDPKMAERFKSEIKLARKIRHRNVCAIHDYGEDRGLLYISMELIEGVDFKRILRERGALPHEEAYELAIQVCEGLQAVHDAGIIHRDLKTPNIMRDGQGVARLMDFGVAKRHGAEGTMTATGHIVGTPEYMSPEQAQGHKVDFRSDIYALGIVIYEVFTGHVPFRGETPISTILKHINDPPPLDGPPASQIPADLKPVLRRALAKDPADRYASARELAQALRWARSPSRRQQPIATEVLEAPTLPRARRAGGSLGLRAALLALPVVALAAGLWWFSRGSTVPSPSTPAGPAGLASPTPPAAHPLVTTPPAPEPTPASVFETPAPAVREASPRPSPMPRSMSSVPSPPGRAGRATPEPTPRPPRPTPVPAATPAAAAPAPPTTLAAPVPAASEEGAGLLHVVARPWAEVAVDGKVVGTTPFDKIALPAGVHTVRLRHPAYEPVELRVTVRAGQTEKVLFDFPTQGVRRP